MLEDVEHADAGEAPAGKVGFVEEALFNLDAEVTDGAPGKVRGGLNAERLETAAASRVEKKAATGAELQQGARGGETQQPVRSLLGDVLRRPFLFNVIDVPGHVLAVDIGIARVGRSAAVKDETAVLTPRQANPAVVRHFETVTATDRAVAISNSYGLRLRLRSGLGKKTSGCLHRRQCRDAGCRQTLRLASCSARHSPGDDQAACGRKDRR